MNKGTGSSSTANGASMTSGDSASCPVSIIITDVPLNENHQLKMP